MNSDSPDTVDDPDPVPEVVDAEVGADIEESLLESRKSLQNSFLTKDSASTEKKSTLVSKGQLGSSSKGL